MKKMISMVTLLVIAFLAGCQPSGVNTGQTASEKAQKDQPATAAANEKKITMRFSWWGSDSRNQATLKAIELYHKLHPNITIEGESGAYDTYYQKLLTQFASKTAPDIVQVDYQWVGDLVRQGKPFTNVNDLSNIIDMSKFPSDPIKGYMGEGNYVIGVPAGINGQGFFYNTEFFKKFGIQPGNDWTWDKVLEVGAMVNKQDKNSHLLFFEKNAILYLVRDWVKQKYGVNMFKDDYTMAFNEQDLANAFTYVKKLVDTGTIPPMEEMVLYDSLFPDQVPNWLNGQWGMARLGASNLPSIIAASTFKIDTMRWMVQPGAKDSAITVSPTQLLSVNDSSPNKTEAAKFINWFLTDDQALAITTDTRGVPVNTHAKKILEDKGLIQKPVGSMLEQAIAQPGSADNAITLNPQLADITRQYIYKVGYKKLTPEDAARQALVEYKKVLDELKSKQK